MLQADKAALQRELSVEMVRAVVPQSSVPTSWRSHPPLRRARPAC